MTTLVGIVAKDGKPGVVLASDVTITYPGWESTEGASIARQKKQQTQKIYVDAKREVAVAMTGVGDAPYYEFLGKLLDGKISFRKAIKKQMFKELYKLNYGRFEGRLWDPDHQNGLLVATRYGNKPRLWRCWPLGRVEERQMSAIGSGSDYAVEYLRSRDILRPHGLKLPQAIALSAEAMERASTDIHTGGLDIVVITSGRINEHGRTIAQALKETRRKEVGSLTKQYGTKSADYQSR